MDKQMDFRVSKLLGERVINSHRIKDIEEIIKILKTNTLEGKAVYGLPFMGAVLFISIILLPDLVNAGVIASWLMYPISVIAPIVAGALGGNLLLNKLDYKCKLANVTEAKTNKELLKEITKKEIEAEQLKSRNRVIDQEIDLITRETDDVIEESASIENLDEIKKKKSRKDAFVDSMTARVFLKEKYKKIRENKYPYLKLLSSIFTGVATSLAIYAIPFMRVVGFEAGLPVAKLALPLVLGALGGAAIFTKKRHDEVATFSSSNISILGGDMIDAKTDDFVRGHELSFESDLEKAIKDAAALDVEVKKLELMDRQEADNEPSVSTPEKDMIQTYEAIPEKTDGLGYKIKPVDEK